MWKYSIYPKYDVFINKVFTWFFSFPPEVSVIPKDIIVRYSIDGLPFVTNLNIVSKIVDRHYKVDIPVECINGDTVVIVASDNNGRVQCSEALHIGERNG